MSTTPTLPPGPKYQPQNAPPVKKVPAWAAVVVILLLLGGGLWLSWRLIQKTPPTVAIEYKSVLDPQVGGQAGGRQRGGNNNRRWQPPTPDAITPYGPNLYIALSGDAQARIVQRGDQWTLRLQYQNDDYIPKELVPPLQARAMLTGRRVDPASTRPAGATPQQMDKIRQVEPSPGIALTDAQEKALLAEFEAYRTADDTAKPDQQTKFIAALKTAADGAKDATIAEQRKRADAVRAVLSPEQIQTLNAAAQGD